MKNRVAIFARVSTDHQSYERQIVDLTQYAQSRNLEVVEIITEKISGAKDNTEREGIIQLRALANQGKFDRILVTELSRLGHNAYQVATLIHDFTELGISIVVQSLGIETLSDEGKANPLIDLLIAVVNQFSSMKRTFLIDRISIQVWIGHGRTEKHWGNRRVLPLKSVNLSGNTSRSQKTYSLKSPLEKQLKFME